LKKKGFLLMIASIIAMMLMSVGCDLNGSYDDDVAAPYIGIGMPYQGGVVVYILKSGDPGYDADQTHGLIAAIADQSQSPGIPWATSAYDSTPVPGSAGMALGTGSANTNKIIAQHDATSIDCLTYAAGLAHACTDGNYGDWYLPSLDELAKLYEYRINFDPYGQYSGGTYWSSSSVGVSKAWTHRIYSGFREDYLKGNDGPVRAFRSF
jgi:hypothetical protein